MRHVSWFTACCVFAVGLWPAPRGAAADEGPASASVAPARPQRIGAYPGHEHHPTKKWIARLLCSPQSYTLQHWACYDKSHAPQAIALEGQIGLMAPDKANWYFNGFFNFSVGRLQGRNFAVKCIRALDSGPRASCEFVWELPNAWVRVRFLVVPGKEPLFCSIAQAPKGDPEPLTVRLVCYPSAYVHRAPRVGLTARRAVNAPAKAALDPAAEPWVIFYDKRYDLGVSDGEGGCAAFASPRFVAASKLDVGHYGCVWTLTAKPGVKEMRFAFWEGLRRRNAELIPYLRGRFGPAAAELERLDFRPLRLQPAWLARTRKEFDVWRAKTPGAAAVATAFDARAARLQALLARLEKGGVDIAAEDEALRLASDMESLVWKIRMKWVLSD